MPQIAGALCMFCLRTHAFAYAALWSGVIILRYATASRCRQHLSPRGATTFAFLRFTALYLNPSQRRSMRRASPLITRCFAFAFAAMPREFHHTPSRYYYRYYIAARYIIKHDEQL
jgi:hypothetical protein